MHTKGKKVLAMLVCGIAYIFAFIICYLLFPLVDHLDPVLSAALLDVAATVFIFTVSRSFNNSSFYDPYWSVAPLPIIVFWCISAQSGQVNSVRQILIVSLIAIWAVRLTWNWGRRWKGIADEDWRYAGFREQFGKAYWVISFLGIHFFPTVIVFIGLLPVYAALTAARGPISLIDILAGMITLHAILLETAADEQLRRFTNTNKIPGRFLQSGLWKYSRHPNYLGEVTFWIGLFLFSIQADPFRWWYLAGPVAMILLFRFISVPLIDKRMISRRKEYDAYIKKTSPLLLWPPGQG